MLPDQRVALEAVLDIEGQVAVEIRLQGHANHGGGEHGQDEQQGVQPVTVARANGRRNDLSTGPFLSIEGIGRRRKILGRHDDEECRRLLQRL